MAFRMLAGRIPSTHSFLDSAVYTFIGPQAVQRAYAVSSMAETASTPLPPFPDGGQRPRALISDLDGTLTETELLKVNIISILGISETSSFSIH